MNMSVVSGFWINLCNVVSSQPTNHHVRRGQRTHTWLDLFIVNYANSVTKSIASFIGEFGHDFIEMVYKMYSSPKQSKTIWTSKLKSLDQTALTRLISAIWNVWVCVTFHNVNIELPSASALSRHGHKFCVNAISLSKALAMKSRGLKTLQPLTFALNRKRMK